MPPKKRKTPSKRISSAKKRAKQMVDESVESTESYTPSSASGFPVTVEETKKIPPAPVYDEYLDQNPGPSRPREMELPEITVSTVFHGKDIIDVDKLTEEELQAITTGHISEMEDTDDESVGSQEDDEREDQEVGESFSDLLLVEPVSDPVVPHPVSPAPSPTLSQPPPVRPMSTTWHPHPVPPSQIPFLGSPGLKETMDQQEPWDFFKLLFTDSLVNNIIEETNVNAEHIFLQTETPRARITAWNPLTLGEFYTFLGLIFHTGHVVMSQIRDYWRTDRLFKFPLFGECMSRDRFEGILNTLYFNRRPPPDQDTDDKLYKLRPVLDHFNVRMGEVYSPHREMSIDESMILWRGRLAFRQYIKTKRYKYGVKLYILAENSGLVHKIIIYTGAADNVPSEGRSHAHCVVDTLLEKFKGQGHSIFMDNFFTSVPLVTHLLNGNLYCTGTLRANRKGNPKEVTVPKLKRRGDLLQRWNEDGICVLKWHDKRDVLMISSEFSGDLEETQNKRGQVSSKPKAVIHYNKSMGGVDRLDQLLSYSLTSRKTIRWYKKVVFHIFQIMLTNSFNLYKNTVPGRKLNLKDFRCTIVGHLIDEGKRLSEINKPPVPSPSPRRHVSHFPDVFPFREGTNRHKQKDCRQCTTKGIQKKSNYTCTGCPDKPGLCIVPCFMEYHVQKNLLFI